MSPALFCLAQWHVMSMHCKDRHEEGHSSSVSMQNETECHKVVRIKDQHFSFLAQHALKQDAVTTTASHRLADRCTTTAVH